MAATSLIGPEVDCLAYVPYGSEQLLVHDIDLSLATGCCARRFNRAFYLGFQPRRPVVPPLPLRRLRQLLPARDPRGDALLASARN